MGRWLSVASPSPPSCAPWGSSESPLASRLRSSSSRHAHRLLQGPCYDAVGRRVGRIRCSSRDGQGNSFENGDALGAPPPDIDKLSSASLTKIAQETANAPQPLQRVIETFRTSLVCPFLIGMVLLLDITKATSLLEGWHQIRGLTLTRMIVGSYSVLFMASMAMSTVLGFICIPFLRKLKAYQIIRREGPAAHFAKSGTPTMGGLFFIPAALVICAHSMNNTSVQLGGLMSVTLLFGGIGLLDDVLSLVRKHNYGLPGWCKLVLQVISGAWFFLWTKSSALPADFEMKTILLLPPPLKHLNLGAWYLPLTAFCFAAMSNGVNLTDGLDGLAAGCSAAAFAGMAIAALNIYPVVTFFGVSMAGACLGFLVHNHHKATVFMGDTGSLALGGALAAMAASTGLFLPLFICSGVFFVETVSVILQISYKKYTKKFTGITKKLFRMAPIHHHFELGGMKESTIVTIAHIISCALAVFGAIIGLVISKGS